MVLLIGGLSVEHPGSRPSKTTITMLPSGMYWSDGSRSVPVRDESVGPSPMSTLTPGAAGVSPGCNRSPVWHLIPPHPASRSAAEAYVHYHLVIREWPTPQQCSTGGRAPRTSRKHPCLRLARAPHATDDFIVAANSIVASTSLYDESGAGLDPWRYSALTRSQARNRTPPSVAAGGTCSDQYFGTAKWQRANGNVTTGAPADSSRTCGSGAAESCRMIPTSCAPLQFGHTSPPLAN